MPCLSRPAPKRTSSSILSLRLRRRFHSREAPRPAISYATPLHAPHAINTFSWPSRYFQNINGISRPRYATTESSPLLSNDAFAHVKSLLTRPGAIGAAEPLDQLDESGPPAGNGPDVPSNSVNYGYAWRKSHASNVFVDRTRKFLLAIREGDTLKALTYSKVIDNMSQNQLQALVKGIPRTAFTEIFRVLDPLRVSRDCDAIDNFYTPMGMIKMLFMDAIIDDWGVRKIYISVLKRLLILMQALIAANHTLNMEEYISLIRCAGACSDIWGAQTIWGQMITKSPDIWLNAEAYAEFIKARFITEPLYTNYQKITRMVTPRDLHRSRLMLRQDQVRRLDALRLVTLASRRRLGLNKEVNHVEEQMRRLRGSTPALKLWHTVQSKHALPMDERLLCAFMVGLGRSGSLRAIGTEILEPYFKVRTPHPWPPLTEAEAVTLGNDFSMGTPRIRPTVRLMRAVVEAYGSNAEINAVLQLVDYLSNKYDIPIPSDVWTDILEWTHVMCTPPASTAWKIACLDFKIPSPKAVEMIWNAMTGPPYNQVPTFEQYNVLIRSLIGRRADDLTLPIVSHMRKAVAMYDEQCLEYEAAAFEYMHHRHGKIKSSPVILRFQRARFKKERMWYHISVWCRSFLKKLKYSLTNPVPNPIIPAFIQEFRPFIKNPIEYKTPTGRVRMVDHSLEAFKRVPNGVIDQVIPIRNTPRKHNFLRNRQRKVAVFSSHSLQDQEHERHELLDLLWPPQDATKKPDRDRADESK